MGNLYQHTLVDAGASRAFVSEEVRRYSETISPNVEEPILTGSKHVVGHAPLTPEQREETARILDRLVGTPIERTGDIAVEVGDKRYVFRDHGGARTAASVERDGGTEMIRSRPPYRRTLVKQVAQAGLENVPPKAQGEEFTLRALSAKWDELTDTEQRNAGKQFRRLIETEFPGEFDSWTTTNNERHYRGAERTAERALHR